ncbi:MAG: hypothetical protein Q4A58_04005 [Fusobacterium sp.]|uniref:hypothetical protein n=1 Tax=Fusobacterium sp. TaxID=68766 RepID=UPI0026DB3728|nr:hypothetical protein [Fusobacterium sp.]MDO4690442.1 hypothetical protein [Fusobacterium sp.]
MKKIYTNKDLIEAIEHCREKIKVQKGKCKIEHIKLLNMLEDLKEIKGEAMENKKYCYSFDDENYSSDIFNSEKEAIEAAKKEFADNNLEKDYPGRIIFLAEAFLYEEDFNSLANTLLCEMQERAEWLNDYSSNYMCLTFEHRDIFQKMLKKMIESFQRKFGYEPNFYNIERIGKIEF